MDRIGDPILYAGAAGAPLLVLLAHGDETEAVHAAVRAQTAAPFSLLGVAPPRWNDDLTPWPAEPLRRDGEPFGGGAEAFLDRLTGDLLPSAAAQLGDRPAFFALAGYSLAGLFAVWALYRTPLFHRAASVSGSLWYPGFRDFALREKPAGVPERLYFSLGDREARTRHPLLRAVEDDTLAVERRWADLGCRTVFEHNPGGHFPHGAERTARALAWLLRE